MNVFGFFIILGIVVYFYPIKIKWKLSFKSKLYELKNNSKHIEESIKRINKNRLEKDLISASILLKTLSLLMKDEPMTTDYVIEQLLLNSKDLKPYFIKCLAEYRLGNKDKAFNHIKYANSGKAFDEFVSLLRKFDEGNGYLLANQIESFKDYLIEERSTYKSKLNDRYNMIYTVIVTINIFALIINFAIVVIFTDAIKMLNMIW